MAVIGWGKPRIIVQNLSTKKYFEVPTPIENSTKVNPTKGDKKEATLEGGEYEDVRYTKNKYELVYQIRVAKGKTLPFHAHDGKVNGNYAVYVVPEDPEVPGARIDKSVVTASENYTSEEGGYVEYTHDALKPDDGTDQIKWGVVTPTESDGTISDIAFEEIKYNENGGE